MKLKSDQIMQGKTLLSELDPFVAQELDWLLQLAATTIPQRMALYEQWETQSPHVSEFGEDQTNPLSQYLMDVFNQGRVPDLLASLERLLMLGVQLTLTEFAELTQELVKRPWPLSRTELEIVRMLYENPTASAVAIAQTTGFHRQTVANYLRQLYFALQISCYPIVNYHALGLRRIQIWFRGSAEIPTNFYFYSRLALTGNNERWLLDTWSVPTGAEDLLLERYRRLERNRQIHDLAVREIISSGKHLSLSTYEEAVGWRSEPEVVKQVYQRALKGQDLFVPRQLEIMPYGMTDSRLDTIDIGIIEALWKDYLLGQTKEAVAIQLGISRSSLTRRLQRLECAVVIKPSLWLKTENMVQTAFTIPISETQVLNALMCLPVVYFYLIEAKESMEREWFVVAKSTPAVANVLANAQINNNSNLESFNTHIVNQQNGSRLFRAYNNDTKAWNQDLFIVDE
ncbi:MAG: hypothetical protein ACXAB4_10855 [Candidatus Hodarchaeales archaeon]|jgi:DNA-binding Lrp family transcriptional regulator